MLAKCSLDLSCLVCLCAHNSSACASDHRTSSPCLEETSQVRPQVVLAESTLRAASRIHLATWSCGKYAFLFFCCASLPARTSAAFASLVNMEVVTSEYERGSRLHWLELILHPWRHHILHMFLHILFRYNFLTFSLLSRSQSVTVLPCACYGVCIALTFKTVLFVHPRHDHCLVPFTTGARSNIICL